MSITASQVKKLRDRTWIWMMECKKALIETKGDIEKAIEELRKKGLTKAAKKADRETSEWAIKILIENGKAYMVSVSCETDFLASSDRFKDMMDDVVNFLKKNNANSKKAAQEFINSKYSLELGENLQVTDYDIVSWEVLSAYTHSNWKLAALVVAKKGTDKTKLKQIAMHVTAVNPEYLRIIDISDEVVEKEKAIQLDIMKNDPKMQNKTDDVLLKIIEWKMSKFKSEISLLEQDFVIDPNVKIKNFIDEDAIVEFRRFSI